MTTVYPISSVKNQEPAATTTRQPQEQFGQDTFLKLLVAQLKYQDPTNPTDATQFLSQTAQFTQIETLQKIAKEQETQAAASEMLAATTLVGRQVSYALNNGSPQAPTGTSMMQVRGNLPKDAPLGTHVTTTTDVFTKAGAKIPLKLDFVRTDTGWSVQAMNGSQKLGEPIAISFDGTGNHSGNIAIPAAALNGIANTGGDWPTTGISLAFGDATDPTRLQMGSGSSTVMVMEQNGNDGTKANGVVSGVHITADGPKLVIGGQDIPYTSITDVHV
jgi:flagellar basal-body rod modification protein FlgD